MKPIMPSLDEINDLKKELEVEETVKVQIKSISESINGSCYVDLQDVEGEELATFGAGCYWGTEKYYAVNYEKAHPGAILGQAVGFMSPNEDAQANPKYKEVCKGTTGHVEVL